MGDGMSDLAARNERKSVDNTELRKQILEAAIAHTCDSREAEYGSPALNLGNCAELWGAYLRAKYQITLDLTSEDVAWLNVLQKAARTFTGPPKPDTYEDAAAYAAIAGELRCHPGS